MTADAHRTRGVQPPPGSRAELDQLAVQIEQARAAWHRARQARADALALFDRVTRDESEAAAAYRAAVTAYDAAKGVL
jgi:hypothetical protein